MTRTQLKLGKCKFCKNTLIVKLDEDLICNSWGCFEIFRKKDMECFDIKGVEKLVHGIYHE